MVAGWTCPRRWTTGIIVSGVAFGATYRGENDRTIAYTTSVVPLLRLYVDAMPRLLLSVDRMIVARFLVPVHKGTRLL